MSKHHARNQPSQRQRQVNELLRHALAEIFLRYEIADDDLAGVAITVTEVRTTPDLKNARVYIVPLGGANQDKVLAALERNTRFLRGELARRVELKFSPALSFALDTTFDQSDRVEALLRSERVARDLG
jgi:ribosome-binding factor A